MTTEIVVMNREGIALAADSVVTYGGSKTFNTANKLFMLAPGYPVGILIFNNANFMDLPWEIIIKLFRDHVLVKKTRLDKLEDYGKLFIKYIEQNGNKFSTFDQQKHMIMSMVEYIFGEIVGRSIWEKIEEEFYKTAARISEEKIAEISHDMIQELHQKIDEVKSVFSDDEINEIRERLFQEFNDIIQHGKEHFLGNLPLSDEDREVLDNICLLFVTKPGLSSVYTGVVFAGYGENDLFPACAAYNIESFLCGKLRYIKDEVAKIDFSGPSAAIIPFAQADVVENFLQGRHTKYIDAIFEELNGKLPEDEIEKILNQTEKKIKERHTNSIMSAVNALPKEDLALMAESLVSLTSFMRKVSMSQETVGEPIDVAVISKKDGFVWIKRKHYFDIKNNLHYKLKYKKENS